MNHLSLSFTQSSLAFRGIDTPSPRPGCHGQARVCGNNDVQTETGKTLPGAINADDALSSSLSSLTTAIGALRDRLNQLAGSSDTTTEGDVAGSVTAFSASMISKQRGELTIHTLEGDEVTLRFSNKLRVDYSSQSAESGDVSVSSESLEMRSRSRVGISVDGNLNEQEMAAINDLVAKVGDLANDFYDGSVDDALANASSLDFDSSQLADYSLSLSLKQCIRVQDYRYTALPPAATPAPAPSCDPVPVSEPAVVPVTNPTEAIEAAQVPPAESVATPASPADPVVPAETAPVVADASPSTTPVSETPEATTPAATPPVSAQQILAEYTAKVRQKLTVSSTDAMLGFSYEFKVRLLISTISQTAPQSAPAASALGILSDQLQAVTV